MSQKHMWIFTGLKVVAWIIFVGLCIEAGAIIVNFILSIFNPELVSHLYEKLDMSDVYEKSRWSYFSIYSLIICIALLKAFLFYSIIQLITKFDWAKPFSKIVAVRIEKISQFTLAIGIVSFIAQRTTAEHSHHGYDVSELYRFWEDTEAFILMAGIIYVISVIFTKGVELQNENDLTV